MSNTLHATMLWCRCLANEPYINAGREHTEIQDSADLTEVKGWCALLLELHPLRRLGKGAATQNSGCTAGLHQQTS